MLFYPCFNTPFHRQNYWSEKDTEKRLGTNVTGKKSTWYLHFWNISWLLEYHTQPCRSSHRDFFRKYLFGSSRSTFFWIFYVFAEQMPIFQEGLSVHRTDTKFPEWCGLFTKQITFFQELPNRYQFSRSTFLATGQIQISEEHFFWLPNRYHFFSLIIIWKLYLTGIHTTPKNYFEIEIENLFSKYWHLIYSPAYSIGFWTP